MPRDPKALTDWLELDYYRRPRGLRRVKGWLIGLVLVGTAVAVAAYHFTPSGRLAYQAGPVSAAHAMFNSDCAQCHAETFQTVKRLLPGDEPARSVTDEACSRCHDGPIHARSQSHTPACVTCHREHRGMSVLSRVADDHCTACHGRLPEHCHGSTTLQNVTGFPDGHPEFAPFWEGTPRDAGTLLFNHEVHLDLKKEDVQNTAGVEALARLKEQQCVFCHQVDVTRRLMAPVRYDQHCAACHELPATLSVEKGDAAVLSAAEAFRQLPAPHKEPMIVRTVLRERYLQLAREHPAVLDGIKAPEPDRLLPGRRGLPPVTEKQWQWADRQLQEAERVLFGGSGGCAHCHQETTKKEQRPHGLPEYALTDMPKVWLSKGLFHHEAHRMLSCVACHESAAKSRATADVLIPKIDSCKSCHNTRIGARSDCVECHWYHDKKVERSLDGKLPISGWMK